jgi:hypothetical protein
MSYVNLNNPANFQLQEFEQLGFRYIVSGRPTIGGETYRTIFVLTDAVVTATCPNGDSLSSETLVAGTVIHGFFEDVSVASGSLLAYKAGPITAQEIFDAYKAYVYAQGGIVEGESCAVADIAALLEDKLYSAASLVLIPSGYKVSHLYAERPLDSNGDFTFTRASSATRVGPDGLIEKVRTNLVTYSEEFDDAVWNKYNSSTVTANSTTAPNGTTTADTLNSANVIFSGIYQGLGTLASIVYTYSIYAKANTNNYLCMLAQGSGSQYAFFNLSTGTVGNSANIDSASIENVGNGWYRCQIQKTGNGVEMFVFSSNIENLTPTASGSIYIWGAQFETGDIATDYIATTTAAVSVGPVANLPRLDYLNSSCPRLLLEPQRTNLHANSETSTSFSLTNCTYSSNVATSPDGYANADKLVEDATTNVHRVSGYGGVMANTTTYTSSFFAKKDERDQLYILIPNSVTSSRNVVVFNLTTGVSSIVSGTNVSAHSMVDYGNGWYRCIATFITATVSGTNLIGIWEGSESYTGDGTSGLYLWGYMNEAGAYATSYIGPTSGTAVTRLADACSKTGISSLIGQTEGTLYFEFDYKYGQINTSLFDTSLSSNDNIYLLALSDFSLRMWIFVGGVNQVAISTVTIPTEGRHKVAMAYKENDCAFYLDGVQIGVDTSCTIPAVEDLFLRVPNQDTRQVLVFKTRLTNADLATLTTL